MSACILWNTSSQIRDYIGPQPSVGSVNKISRRGKRTKTEDHGTFCAKLDQCANIFKYNCCTWWMVVSMSNKYVYITICLANTSICSHNYYITDIFKSKRHAFISPIYARGNVRFSTVFAKHLLTQISKLFSLDQSTSTSISDRVKNLKYGHFEQRQIWAH